MMKFILFFHLIFGIIFRVNALELKAGDVILISFNCYECRIIESETNSHYSHSGVVIKDTFGNIKIGQSLGEVKLSKLEDFLKNKTPNTEAHVFRSIEIESKLNRKFEKRMFQIYEQEYSGLSFDSRYNWNNFDEFNRELLYCSEFIAKYLDNFQAIKTEPEVLKYEKNYDFWFKHFNGNIPLNELGNSPTSFSHDKRFYFVGVLE